MRWRYGTTPASRFPQIKRFDNRRIGTRKVDDRRHNDLHPLLARARYRQICAKDDVALGDIAAVMMSVLLLAC